jgi:hypothetical protein
MDNTEEWREYKNTGYWISNMGNIMNKYGRYLKLPLTPNGYCRIEINRKFHFVHMLVARCFIGEIPDGLVIDHINQIRNDNRIENLRYITQQENCMNTKKTRTDILEQNPIIRKMIVHIDSKIRTGKYKNPREEYIQRIYNRFNHQEK